MANDLYEDMRILNSLYEELMWDTNDDLQFSIEDGKIVITNLNLKKEWNPCQNLNIKWNQVNIIYSGELQLCLLYTSDAADE